MGHPPKVLRNFRVAYAPPRAVVGGQTWLPAQQPPGPRHSTVPYGPPPAAAVHRAPGGGTWLAGSRKLRAWEPRSKLFGRWTDDLWPPPVHSSSLWLRCPAMPRGERNICRLPLPPPPELERSPPVNGNRLLGLGRPTPESRRIRHFRGSEIRARPPRFLECHLRGLILRRV